MLLKKNSITNKLLNLGFHIGHTVFDIDFNFKVNNQFILGRRNMYQILNLNFTIFYLQKSMFFLKNLTSNFNNILFYYSNLDSNSDISLSIKLFMKDRVYTKTR